MKLKSLARNFFTGRDWRIVSCLQAEDARRIISHELIEAILVVILDSHYSVKCRKLHR